MGETDSPQGDSASQEAKGTTSDSPTYTKKQVDKMVSDALAKAGRDAKSLELKEKSLKEREDEINEWRKKQEQTELEAIRDNPQALDLYQKGKAIEQAKADLLRERAELAKQKQEFDEDIKLAKETRREIAIWEIASKYSVDPMTLKELGLESMEQVEAVAKAFAPERPPEPSLKPDSGMTAGGGDSVEGKPARVIFAEMYRKQKK